jgi:hypothetical protein
MEATNGTRPTEVLDPPSMETRSIPDIRSEELDRMLDDVRMLARGMQDANAYWLGGSADIQRVAETLLAHIETLPSRIADAITVALAKQHRMIITDIHSAFAQLATQLQSSGLPDDRGV